MAGAFYLKIGRYEIKGRWTMPSAFVFNEAAVPYTPR